MPCLVHPSRPIDIIQDHHCFGDGSLLQYHPYFFNGWAVPVISIYKEYRTVRRILYQVGKELAKITEQEFQSPGKVNVRILLCKMVLTGTAFNGCDYRFLCTCRKVRGTDPQPGTQFND